ncbi:hypothetical protein RND81_01G210100 [Saponaria officinalis]|uniref:Defensin-like protein n=1 Tax=Saponaria officinalis TaxID=3572 RepID=A0AAW1NG73_SAPOF
MALNFYLTLIFFFVISGNMVSRTLGDGQICSFGLGNCASASDCTNKCQSSHPGGQGTCDGSSTSQCMCFFNCPPPPAPTKPLRPCTSNNGACSRRNCGDQCCDTGCKSKYPGSSTYGTCEEMAGLFYISLCLCHFQC